MSRIGYLFVPMLMLWTAGCFGQVSPRLLDSMEDPTLYTPSQPEPGHVWTGTVTLDTTEAKEGAGCLRFDVQSARSGAESYPQWGRSLDRASNDWTAYRALRYWVKVVSEDPTVTHKAMCIVVYNGHSPLQQFVRHVVPVGQWVQLSDSLLSYQRDQVRGIVIYLYETDPSKGDNYTWWVDGLELVPWEEGEEEFDGYLIRAQPAPVRQPIRQLATGDGLELAFDAAGRIVRVGDRAGSVWGHEENAAPASGFLIKDHREQGVRRLDAPVSMDGGGLRQAQRFPDGLFVEATLQPEAERLRGHITVRDTGQEDRPLTVYFAVPVEATGWTWWDDVRTAREIGGRGDFWYTPWYPLRPRWSGYPFCCIANEAHALSLAVPMIPPRVHRTVYDPRQKLLYVAFDFCLTPAATKQNQTAEFEFELFLSDPAWGFRSTVQRYYDLHPEFFERRMPRYGGWGCWGTFEGNDKIPELGFLYHWGPDERGGARNAADPVRFDDEHGYYSFPYIEWTNMHLSMEGYERATSEDILERVRYIADPERTEPLPNWSYWFPYDSRLGPDRDGWMRRVFQCYLVSLIFDRNGQLYGEADRSEFGILAAKYIPFNADPDIPGGAGDFFLNTWWPQIEQYYAEHGVQIDGFGWDNFYVKGSSLDYRREHFAYADEPLTFDPDTLQPAILKDMATYELQKETVKRLREMGRYLIANQGAVSMVIGTLPLLDIFGYEWNIENAGIYARTMARTKPVCSLPIAPEHYRDPFVREHLLFGLWPGGYYSTAEPEYVALLSRYVPILRRLTAAGWEPVTRAWCDHARVQVERFGGPGEELLFTLKNRSAEGARVQVRVDPGLLEPGARYEARELVTGTVLGQVEAAEAPAFVVEAPVGEVLVVALEPQGAGATGQ